MKEKKYNSIEDYYEAPSDDVEYSSADFQAEEESAES